MQRTKERVEAHIRDQFPVVTRDGNDEPCIAEESFPFLTKMLKERRINLLLGNCLRVVERTFTWLEIPSYDVVKNQLLLLRTSRFGFSWSGCIVGDEASGGVNIDL